MSTIFWKSLAVAPIVLLGITFSASNALSGEVSGIAIAPDSANTMIETSGSMNQMTSVSQLTDGQSSGAMAQVTSVSQLTDVKPTDWAFQALQSLVERYGCIVGYPDKTYRGNRALSRYEFAAGLNACLDKIQELIAAATADFVRKEDLEVVKRLQEEFAAELGALRGRVDALEVRTATLEKQQFSTTTKLNGEVIFAASNLFGDDKADGDNDHDDLNADNTVFTNRVRLNFDSSFTGRDRLRVRLEAGNAIRYNAALTGTDMTRLGFDFSSANAFRVSMLQYRFPLGNKATFYIAPIDETYRGPFESVVINSLWPSLEAGGFGAISRFGRMNPIYRQGGDGAYAAFDYRLSRTITFSAGYFVNESFANNPGDGGLFGGTYTARAHLLFRPTPKLALGLGYSRSYFKTGSGVSGGTGSNFANNPFNGAGTLVNSYTAEARYRFSPRFILAGWVTLFDAEAQTGVNSGRQSDILGYSGAMIFPDLGKKGNLGAIIIGQPPKVLNNDLASREDPDTSLHLELLYRYRLTDNISITPGVFVVTKPNHNDNNDPIFVGTIRTTFTF